METFLIVGPQSGNSWQSQVEQLPPQLRRFGLLFEWLRAELGLRLNLSEASREACQDLCGQIDAAGSATGSPEWLAIKDRTFPLLDVNIRSLYIDEAVAESIRDDVLNTEVD